MTNTSTAPALGLQDETRWWTKKRVHAAQLLADKDMTDQQIANTLKVGRTSWLARFKRHPLAQARIAALQAAATQLQFERSVASKDARLADLQYLRDMAMSLIQARGGLEATDVKMAANGDTVDVKYTDKAVADILMKALDDAAKEMGHRQGDKDGAMAGVVVNFFGVEPGRLG